MGALNLFGTFLLLVVPMATEPTEEIKQETIPFDGITINIHYAIANDRMPEYIVELVRENFDTKDDLRKELLVELHKLNKYQLIELSKKYDYMTICLSGHSYIGGFVDYKAKYEIVFHNSNIKFER